MTRTKRTKIRRPVLLLRDARGRFASYRRPAPPRLRRRTARRRPQVAIQLVLF